MYGYYWTKNIKQSNKASDFRVVFGRKTDVSALFLNNCQNTNHFLVSCIVHIIIVF